MSQPTGAATASMTRQLCGPARRSASLRPLAASALGGGWHGDRRPAPRVSTPLQGRRGFASQPIGRITPEGFTEKAWEVGRFDTSSACSNLALGCVLSKK